MIVLQFSLFLLGIIGFFVVSYFGLKSFKLILLGALLLLSQSFIGLFYSFLQAERRVLIQIKASIIQSITQLSCFAICYTFFKEDLGLVLFSFFLSYFLPIIYIVYVDRIFNLLSHKGSYNLIDLNISKKIISYGLPVCIWFFLFQFYSVGDRILLKYFGITNLVANYVSFRDLALGLSAFITNPLLMASHPIIMQLSKKDGKIVDIQEIISKNIKLLIAFFTPAIIGLFFFGESIFYLIVGKNYMLDTNLMFLVVLSIFFSSVSMYLHKGLETNGKTVLMAKIAFFVALISLIANYIFIPLYGVLACCLVSVLSQVLYCVSVYYHTRKIYQLKLSILFIIKNLAVATISYITVKLVFEGEVYLINKIVVFIIFIIFLFLTTNESRLLFKKHVSINK
jgi:O-antigen/teichoic acid export membrane protein